MKFTRWQDVMIYLAGGDDPICGDDQKEALEYIAKRINRAMSTTYGYFEGRGEPSVSEARNLHDDLVTEYNCHVVLRFLEDEFHQIGESTGKVEDDLWDLHEHSTDAARFYRKAKKGDSCAKQKYYDIVKQMEKEIEDLKAEGNQL